MARLIAFALLGLVTSGTPQDYNQQLKKVLKDESVPASWIYNDLDKGFSEARASGKPLLVVFR